MRTGRYSLAAALLLPCAFTLTLPNRIARPVGESVLASVQYVAGRVAQSSSGVQGLGGSAFMAAEEDDAQVWTALANLERDSKLLLFILLYIGDGFATHVYNNKHHVSARTGQCGGTKGTTLRLGACHAKCQCLCGWIRTLATGWTHYPVSSSRLCRM
jgi:hypothetical protein